MNNTSIDRLLKTKALLHASASDISSKLDGAPVVILVGGSAQHNIDATIAGWSNITDNRETRFRDIVGIIESAKQLEAFFHYMEDDLFQQLKDKVTQRSALSRSAESPSTHISPTCSNPNV